MGRSVKDLQAGMGVTPSAETPATSTRKAPAKKTAILEMPKGDDFIPRNQRGARPGDLPHAENEGAYGDYAAIKLTTQQKAENKAHVAHQSAWDAHETNQVAHEKRVAADANNDLSGFSDSEMDILRGAGRGGGLHEVHAALTESLHSNLLPHAEHDMRVAKSGQSLAVQSTNTAREIAVHLTSKDAQGNPTHGLDPEDFADKQEEALHHQQLSENLRTFSQKHLNAMGKVATIASHLGQASRALADGRDEDAKRSLKDAASLHESVIRHLNSPMTAHVIDHHNENNPTSQVPHVDMSTADATELKLSASDIAPKGYKPEEEREKVTIGTAGSASGFSKGNRQLVTPTHALLKDLKAKYGSKHPDVLKVQQALTRSRTPSKVDSGPKVRGLPVTTEVRNGKSKPVRGVRDAEQQERVNSANSAADAAARKKEFDGHVMKAIHAITNAKPIHPDTRLALGEDNVKKLYERHMKDVQGGN